VRHGRRGENSKDTPNQLKVAVGNMKMAAMAYRKISTKKKRCYGAATLEGIA